MWCNYFIAARKKQTKNKTQLFHWSSRDCCIEALTLTLTEAAKLTKCSIWKTSDSYVTMDWATLSNITWHNITSKAWCYASPGGVMYRSHDIRNILERWVPLMSMKTELLSAIFITYHTKCSYWKHECSFVAIMSPKTKLFQQDMFTISYFSSDIFSVSSSGVGGC